MNRILPLLLLCTAAHASDPARPASDPRNFFEGGAFESWDEATGLPTATAWRWSMPKDPFTTMERATNEWQTGAGSLHLRDDSTAQADKIVDRIVGLRVFEDENGKMNLNLEKAGRHEVLLISQFTLFADCRSRRPAFIRAARPDTAIPLYERVIEGLRAHGLHVETGVFGADMQVISQNDGPVTILLDTDEL